MSSSNKSSGLSCRSLGSAYWSDRIVKGLLWISAITILLILGGIILHIFLKGYAVVDFEFITGMPKENWEQGGVFPAIIGTLYVIIVALSFATPIGVGAAIFLTEFTREGKLTKIIRIGADSLNAIPSIVFGLFGMVLFLSVLKIGPMVLAAGLTLGFMILPTIMRTSEIAIRTVPMHDKEGSYALGATKLQTIKRIILPSSLPGIITGMILGLGRAAGETAPIIFLVTMMPTIPFSIFESSNTLTVILYFLTAEATPLRIQRAYGISLVLVLMVLILNFSARLINKRLSRNIRR